MSNSNEFTHTFLPVEPSTLAPGTSGQFDLYLCRDKGFVLYCPRGELFADETLAKALEVTEFYIPASQKREYENYLAKNLGQMLQNSQVPLKQRAQIFHTISSGVMKKTLSRKLPKPASDKIYKELLNVVNASIKFFTFDDALKSFSQLISHSYQSYSHSVQTMVLLISLLQRTPGMDKDRLKDCGMGALLHDFGKLDVPDEILSKPPHELTHGEWDIIKRHPAKGVRFCSGLPLSSLTKELILFHHERMDGDGFPGGLSGDDIPMEVRALSLVNVYDMLTSEKTYALALTPFEAMNVIREDMKGAIDPDLYKRFAYLLSASRIM